MYASFVGFENPKADEIFNQGMERELEKLIQEGRHLSHGLMSGVLSGGKVAYDNALRWCESPAEQNFWAAAVWSLGTDDYSYRWPTVWSPDSELPTYGFLLVPQKIVGRYRVDIAVYPHQLAIEIDGHDYHERTKDQATRGKRRARDLQLLGWTVLPYSGSDVWNDLFGCCEDVILKSDPQDVVDQLNNLRVPVWNEILRQILQITTIG
jgi:very-short-patch-repair endonuclease